MKIKRVYIAGLLTPRGVWSTNLAIDYIANVRHMIEVGKQVLLAGFIPFIPALDLFIFLSLKEGEVITEPMIKHYSKEWLEVCDALLLTPKWQRSPGTLKEIEFARERNIPVFETLDELIKTKED